MKPTLILLLSLFISIFTNAQGSTTVTKDTAKQDFDVIHCSRWIDLPTFEGGQAAWMHFLTSHIQYTPATVSDQREVIFIVQFIVSKQGMVTATKLLSPIPQNLAAEIIRLINSSPQWVPAKQNGRATSWRVVQQITLKKAAVNVQVCENDPNRFIPIL